jgi:hypothetical protein
MRAVIVALALAGCSQAASEQSEPAKAPKHLTATLSCTVNGTPIGVSACLIGSGQTMGGSLKVTSAGEVKQFTDYDLARENGRTFEIPLTAPFRVTAQANSDSGYVLRMVIIDGSKVVFHDEVTQFGVIDATDSELR